MASCFNLNEIPLLDGEDFNMGHLEQNIEEDFNQPVGDNMLNFDLNEPPLSEAFSHSEAEHNTNAAHHHQPQKARLSSEEKSDLLNFLLTKSSDGQLSHGAIKEAAKVFKRSARTIGKLWNIWKKQCQQKLRYNTSTNYQNCGRKRYQLQPGALEGLGMGERSCMRDIACKLNISPATVHALVKRGKIKPHTNSLHPGLTAMHKKTRLQWVMSMIQGTTLESKSQYFPMFDFVHLDEKWFFQTKKTQKTYLAETEKGQYRSATSSKFIPKVMFTACVARPRYDAEGKCIFDGKIGIFPFSYKEPAKRNSKNREKGTLVTKLIESINKSVTRRMLIDQVIPAIKSKWPQDEQERVIYIQQDNARTHITQEDSEWQQVHVQDGFTFILIQQPANSPDLNILDLGFFRSIQSLMHKKMPKTIDDMMEAVYAAFYQLHPDTLADVWLTLQFVMNEILKCNGGNGYDMPHIGKKKLQALGLLAREIKAPTWAIIKAWDIIHGEENVAEPDAVQEQGNPEQGNHEEDMITTD